MYSKKPKCHNAIIMDVTVFSVFVENQKITATGKKKKLDRLTYLYTYRMQFVPLALPCPLNTSAVCVSETVCLTTVTPCAHTQLPHTHTNK